MLMLTLIVNWLHCEPSKDTFFWNYILFSLLLTKPYAIRPTQLNVTNGDID